MKISLLETSSLRAKAFKLLTYAVTVTLLISPSTVALAATDTTPPTTSITSPTDGSTISGSVSVSADATDDVGVTEVDLYADGSPIGTSTTSPYSFTFDTTLFANGTYTLTTTAFDAAGNAGISPNVNVTINNIPDTTPPTTTVTSPTEGSTISGAISVTATATDDVGVTEVDLNVDGIFTGFSATSPYSFPVDTTSLSDGPHTFSTTAFDAAGNAGDSAIVTATVNNTADATPPTATITAPADGSTVSGTTAITADASDNVGVTKVELYLDNALTDTSTTAPYSFTLDTTTLTNGAHTLLAKAYDAAGNTGDSAVVNTTVDNSSGSGNSADTTPPTAAITAPADGSTSSGSLTINADTSDNVGVTKVELYLDNALTDTSTAAPYSFTLDTTTLTNGAHTFLAKAYDAAGNAGDSAVVNTTVNNSSGGGSDTSGSTGGNTSQSTDGTNTSSSSNSSGEGGSSLPLNKKHSTKTSAVTLNDATKNDNISCLLPIQNPVTFINSKLDTAESKAKAIIEGYLSGNGGFQGDNTSTRAETLKTLMVASCTPSNIAQGTQSDFKDISSDNWAKDYIDSAHQLKIVNGFEDGTYRPDQNITRMETIAMLERVVGNTNPPASCETQPFVDISPDNWAYSLSRDAYCNNIITGEIVDGKRYLYPNELMTKNEIANLIYNYYVSKILAVK